MERALQGMPASPGIVVGPVHMLRWEVPEVPHRFVPPQQIKPEIAKLHEALEGARARLHRVRDRAERQAGSEEAAIFDVQLSILQDPALVQSVEELIYQNFGADKAFDVVMFEWRDRFGRHANPTMRERVGDLVDVHIRVLSLLLGLPDHDPVDVPPGTNAILVTHDLTPSLTVQLDREAIAGIATDAGTRISHVAILARSLGIPAVVGLRDATSQLDGTERAILDGTNGLLIINPAEAEVTRYRERARHEAEEEVQLRTLAGAEPISTDGVRITLQTNVDLPEDAEAAANSGADGVGLMRTEFLVIGRTTMPDEEEQYRAYRDVIEVFGGRPVTIRTFDIGGDKLPVGGYPAEPNPFLGWRAIRMCLDEPELFSVQLRAILRAAAHGPVRILLPLVVSLDEVRATRELLDRAAADLDERGVSFGRDVRLGVMIETPAAAVAADSFAGHAEFFSIGTNDLVQYTLAVDRGNANIAHRFTPMHPAVLWLIRRTVMSGEQHGIDVAVCGEMASDPLHAFALIGLGVRDLSVSPRAVPVVKRLIRSIAVADARAASEEALRAPTAQTAEDILRGRYASLMEAAAITH